MSKYLDIEVKQEDIDGAIPMDSFRCPVARALKRKYPLAYVRVGLHIILGNSVWKSSGNLVAAIAAYDEYHTFTPGTYRAFKE